MIYDFISRYYIIIPYICIIFLLLERSSEFFIFFSEFFIFFSEDLIIYFLEFTPNFFSREYPLTICKIMSGDYTCSFCYLIDIIIKLRICCKSKVFFNHSFLLNHIFNNWSKDFYILRIHIIIQISISRLIRIKQ